MFEHLIGKIKQHVMSNEVLHRFYIELPRFESTTRNINKNYFINTLKNGIEVKCAGYSAIGLSIELLNTQAKLVSRISAKRVASCLGLWPRMLFACKVNTLDIFNPYENL